MILKAAVNKENFTRRLHFTSAARVGWRHLLRHFMANKRPKILLPAYIGYTDREGSGVFDPVEQTETPFEFYELDNRLCFDLNIIEQKLRTNQFKLMLQIHYFGFEQQDVDEVLKLCHRYDVMLVEDCAHAFQLDLPGYALGTKGDFSFYSMHKYLATTSGGILRVNRDDVVLPEISSAESCTKDVLEQLVRTDLMAVAEKRIANYKYLEAKLSQMEDIEILYPLHEGTVPHDFPLIVKNGLREKLYFHLLDIGIPTIALYYRLIDNIDKASFPVSYDIADNILNLPVHQDTNFDDLDQLCYEIQKTIYFLKT